MRCDVDFEGVSASATIEVVVALVEHLAAESALDVLTLQSLEYPISELLATVSTGGTVRACHLRNGDSLTVELQLDGDRRPERGELKRSVDGFFDVDVETCDGNHVVQIEMPLP